MGIGIFTKKTPTSAEIASILATQQQSTPLETKKTTPREAVSTTILQDQLNQLRTENEELKSHLYEKKSKDAAPIPTAALETAKTEITSLKEKIGSLDLKLKQAVAELETERQNHKKTLEKIKRDYTDIELNLRDEISRLRPEQIQESPDHSVVMESAPQPTIEEQSQSFDINELLEELERNPEKEE